MQFFEATSNINDKVDSVFVFIFALSVLFLVGITATMVAFVIRYSHRRHPQPVNIEGHTALEIAWTVIPLVLFLGMFVYGWTNFEYMRSAPRDAMVIEVNARQWSWSFKYPNGRVTPDLYLALDRPVKLLLHSADVIHGFYVPAFRVKSDVVPGKTNYVWFAPQMLGAYDVECTVICGVDHAHMLAKVQVVPETAFKEWYFGPDDAPPPSQTVRAAPLTASPDPEEPRGLALLRAKGCLACHSINGSTGVGPTFKGRFGTRDVVKRGSTERTIRLDAAYYRRAILEPQLEIVKGYPPVMPASDWAPGDFETVLAYLASLH
jgi:cytochrome c oxidase subunit II